jgi:hypothetical protein
MYDDDPYAFDPDEGSHLYRSIADEEHDCIVNACWCCRLEEAVLKGLCGRCFSDMQTLRKAKRDVPKSN